MSIISGIALMALGSAGASSFYVPQKKIKNWSWESFWAVQSIFAYLLIPFIGAWLIVPSGAFGQVMGYDTTALLKAMGYGMLWGVGGLTFGLSMRYLGVALGQSIALGTCAAFGTIIPPLLAGQDLFATSAGIFMVAGVSVCIAGIAMIGYAGSLKSKNMSEEDKRAAVKEFALKKGILVALLAGVMSACFNLGLNAGDGIRVNAIALGTPELFAKNVVILLVTLGGFITNFGYCIFLNIKNKTGREYFSLSSSELVNNFLFSALAGLLWYCQFLFMGMGEVQLDPGTRAFAWSILMAFNVLFSNVWGIVLNEWKNSGKQTMVVLVIGLLLLVASTIVGSMK